jgi:hypothetical protein
MGGFNFYKDEQGWFVDLPDSGFSKMELQMVMGADDFCEILAQGENNVYLNLSTTPFDGCELLEFIEFGRLEGPEMGEGAWYMLKSYLGQPFNMKMWLCDVTKYVFGGDYFPKNIYFK